MESLMSTTYEIHTQSDRAYTYGLGEVVIPGVRLFRKGEYDLSQEELKALITRKAKASSNA